MKPIFKKYFFNFEKLKNIYFQFWNQRVPPLKKKMARYFKNDFFPKNHTFSTWIWILNVLSFLLRYITCALLKIFDYFIFLLYGWPTSFLYLHWQKYSSYETDFGTYGKLKNKILHWKPFLAIMMPIGCLRKHLAQGGFGEPPHV